MTVSASRPGGHRRPGNAARAGIGIQHLGCDLIQEAAEGDRKERASVAGKYEVGSQFAGVEKRISFETMRKYSGEKGIHAQEEVGKETGLGGALVQGGQLVAYLNQMMTDNFGEGYLRGGDIAVSFIKPVRPGDVITTRGIVQELRSEGTRRRVACEVWLENQAGEKTTVGTATALTPEGSGECEE
jgi:hypothetical protein